MKIWSWLKNKIISSSLPSDFHKLIDPEALQITKRLKESGHQAYLVGGCVRDILMRQAPKDFDIATNATPQRIKHLVPRSFIVGKRFKIVLAKRRLHNSDIQAISHPYFPILSERPIEREIEITTFRRDPEIINGQKNENVFGSAKDDAFRRDFTINGLFLDPSTGEILDYVKGLNDIRKGQLKVIGHPEDRFIEDPIRLLRAIRFIAKTHLAFEAETEKAFNKTLPFLKDAKKERIRGEIIKILRESSLPDTIRLFEKLNVWSLISPVFEKTLKDKNCHTQFHKILEAIKKTPWKHPYDYSPLLFLFLYASLSQPGGQRYLNNLVEEFKIFKTEREDIEHFLRVFLSAQKHPDSSLEKLYVINKNPKHFPQQVKLFYCLFILAQCEIDPFTDHWKKLEPRWAAHAKQLRSRFLQEKRNSQIRRRSPDKKQPTQ